MLLQKLPICHLHHHIIVIIVATPTCRSRSANTKLFIDIVLLMHNYDEWLALLALLDLLALCADCCYWRLRIERRYRRVNGTVVDVVDIVNQWINKNR